MKSRLLCLTALFCVLALGCSRHQQIVLTSRDGSHQLVYDADAFIPQAKSQEDIGVLIDASSQIQQTDPNDAVTKMALISCMLPPPDYKQLERTIYDYKVAQLRKHATDTQSFRTGPIAGENARVDNISSLPANDRPLALAKTGSLSDADQKTVIDLIGHWECVEINGKAVGDGQEKTMLDFLPDQKLRMTQLQNGKPCSQQLSYTINGNDLICDDDKSPPDAANYSLTGDRLFINVTGQGKIVFQRLRQ